MPECPGCPGCPIWGGGQIQNENSSHSALESRLTGGGPSVHPVRGPNLLIADARKCAHVSTIDRSIPWTVWTDWTTPPEGNNHE